MELLTTILTALLGAAAGYLGARHQGRAAMRAPEKADHRKLVGDFLIAVRTARYHAMPWRREPDLQRMNEAIEEAMTLLGIFDVIAPDYVSEEAHRYWVDVMGSADFRERLSRGEPLRPRPAGDQGMDTRLAIQNAFHEAARKWLGE
ncbi:hypothetical protein [Streptomyces lydicus]|uniref:hypothetical protein n=1 Tax=Streptomyces lydicus TaxID=47763 RepID=UPI001013B78C|nr:hypothetical protein [Streptomyces lydicus]MCZ1009008.1 hypothetical protein [Streptomyces lydicus]